jgi:hypothetical protein
LSLADLRQIWGEPVATLHICAYIDQQEKQSSTCARFEVSQTEMEAVPYLDLRAQYRILRSEVASGGWYARVFASHLRPAEKPSWLVRA